MEVFVRRLKIQNHLFRVQGVLLRIDRTSYIYDFLGLFFAS